MQKNMDIILPPPPTRFQILLASNSPRRRELLNMIVPDYRLASGHDTEETYPASIPQSKVPEYLSQIKAAPYLTELKENELLITADTIVLHRGTILGKPVDTSDAQNMLKSLCGNTHHVITGVTLTSTEKSISFSETTTVNFGHISDYEITEYIERFKPLDKAGAYGIQEWIGCIAINSIEGCFYNVMGLPLHALYRKLKEF